MLPFGNSSVVPDLGACRPGVNLNSTLRTKSFCCLNGPDSEKFITFHLIYPHFSLDIDRYFCNKIIY